MKICLLSFGHLDATIPLARYLSEKDEVSLFSIFTGGSKNMDAVNLTDKVINESIINGKQCIKYIESELFEYISNKCLINIVFFKTGNHGTLSFYPTLVKLRKAIDKFKPDIINIVGHTYFLKIIHLSLWNYTRVHTTHEVIAHNEHLDFSRTTSLLQYLVDKNQYFIFPSKVTRERFHKAFKLDKCNTAQIYFGKFELYKLFENKNIVLDKNKILFFGKISPYKGLPYLIEAARICNRRIPDFKLIIAGDGKIELPNDLYQMPYIEIVNRALTNHEVANYIQKCKIVVCPYISASSSGIPMSAYVFNKPVIASDVSGLNEVVQHMETGLLFPPKDSKALANAIELLLLDKTLYEKITSNIKSNNFNQELDWQVISEKTREFYCQIIKKLQPKKITFFNKRIDLSRAGIACLFKIQGNILQLIKRIFIRLRLKIYLPPQRVPKCKL
jgi:glycosyltransferase involved in cell wall biosynthesis